MVTASSSQSDNDRLAANSVKLGRKFLGDPDAVRAAAEAVANQADAGE